MKPEVLSPTPMNVVNRRHVGELLAKKIGHYAFRASVREMTLK